MNTVIVSLYPEEIGVCNPVSSKDSVFLLFFGDMSCSRKFIMGGTHTQPVMPGFVGMVSAVLLLVGTNQHVKHWK